MDTAQRTILLNHPTISLCTYQKILKKIVKQTPIHEVQLNRRTIIPILKTIPTAGAVKRDVNGLQRVITAAY